MHEKVELSGITKQIMPGPSGDLEEWQTLEVNVTLGFTSGDIDLLGLPRVILTSWVCHSSRSPSSPGIICTIDEGAGNNILSENKTRAIYILSISVTFFY